MEFVQSITWYAATGSDGRGGAAFSTPVEVLGRWEKGQNLIRNGRGEEIMTENVVYLDRDVAIGDYIYLGATENVDPIAVSAVEVKGFFKVPSIDEQEYLRKVYA